MSADAATRREIPDATVARLPEYLRALTDFAERGARERLLRGARDGRRGAVHAAAQGPQPPEAPTAYAAPIGYEVDHLAVEISRALGLSQDWPVAIVGMGNLGRALAAYSGFASGSSTWPRCSTTTRPSAVAAWVTSSSAR